MGFGGIGGLAGLGTIAGGAVQGFNQARVAAIQQAYIKLQQQREALMEKQFQAQQERQLREDQAKPLESLLKNPRNAADAGAAFEAVMNPSKAQYDQPTNIPGPWAAGLGRSPPAHLTGQDAVSALMRKAMDTGTQHAQEEYASDTAFKRQMAEENARRNDLLAQSLIGRRDVQNAKDEKATIQKMLLKPQEEHEIQSILDLRDTAYSALNLVNSGKIGAGTRVPSFLSEFGSQWGIPGLENPDLNTANKYFRQNLYAAEKAAGGVRNVASPQMFEVNKMTYANPQYMSHDTLKQVATNSANMADKGVESIRSYMRARGVPEEQIAARLNNPPNVQDPDIILGKKMGPSAAAVLKGVMGGSPQAPAPADNLGVTQGPIPKPSTFGPPVSY